MSRFVFLFARPRNDLALPGVRVSAPEPQFFSVPDLFHENRPSFDRSAVSDQFRTTRSRADVSIFAPFQCDCKQDQACLKYMILNSMPLNMLLKPAWSPLQLHRHSTWRQTESRHPASLACSGIGLKTRRPNAGRGLPAEPRRGSDTDRT